MRNSDVFSPHSSPPSTFAFALLTLLAVSTSPQTARAVPVTRRTPFFLDFLYPEWSTPNTLSTPSSAATGDRKDWIKQQLPEQRSPGSSRPVAAAGVRGSLDTPQQRRQQPQPSQQQPQQQRRRRRRQLPTPTPVSPPLAKRTTANGNLVPVKYESIDQAGGWVIDDTWDLHGHHRRTVDTASTNSSLDGLPVQNLDTANTTDTIDTTDPTDDTDGLDLPFGWQEGGLNPRHESYDPVIVAVFAVILVLCIVATIGLCRWRARKLRRLRDLEKLEKEKDGGGGGDDGSGSGSIGDDGSSESGSRFSEKKKRKFMIGSAGASTSAIRKRFARFRRRHPAKRNAEEKPEEEEEEETPNDQVIRDERTPARPYAASIASSSTTTTTTTTTILSRSSTSHRIRSSATLEDSTPIPDNLGNAISINGMEPDPPAIRGERGRRSSRRGGEHPRITITSSEITPNPTTAILDPTMAMDMEAPNAEPPAYPAGTSTSNTDADASTRRTRRTLTTTPHLPPEKAPIPGLEAEYDDRDLAGYSLHSSGGGGGLLAPNSGLLNSRLSTSGTGTGLSARSSAPPTRRPSRVRFADDHAGEGTAAAGAGAGGENDAYATDLDGEEEEEEQVPSFEPFASSAGTSLGSLGLGLGVLGASRAAAGATLRAHVATDDKGVLERLISVSSEPPPPLSPPPPPMTGDASSSSRVHAHYHPDGLAPPRPAAIVAAAPSFSEIDQWELERQMAQAHGNASPTTDVESSTTRAIQPTLAGSSAFGSSSRRAGTSSNGFPALPAPPLPVFSTGGAGGGGGSGDVGYGLGAVWNSLNVGVGVPSMPPRSRSSTSASGNGKARVPSAPPLVTPATALRPSAPPPPPSMMTMLDGDMGAGGLAMPSAPPAWDDDDDEDGVDGGPILQPGTSSMQGHALDAPAVDENRIVHHQSNTTPVQDNQGDVGSDGDGAESVTSAPPDNEEVNSRWSATFRTRPEEGAGLPRYEP